MAIKELHLSMGSIRAGYHLRNAQVPALRVVDSMWGLSWGGFLEILGECTGWTPAWLFEPSIVELHLSIGGRL